MGLDVSHGCWSGAYSKFTRFRIALAKAADVPLMAMEGYCDTEGLKGLWRHYTDGKELTYSFQELLEFLPVSWESLKPDPIHILLNHSDCDGEISREDAQLLAPRLRELAEQLEDIDDRNNWRTRALQFAEGLELAVKRCEHVRFG